MALNPPMFNVETPMSKMGEFFLCTRVGLSFSLETEGLPKLKASTGRVYLTTSRIVYVAEPAVNLGGGHSFKSFELPLDTMSEEKFNQPIFGANNLTGVVQPIPGMGLTGPSKFKLTFKAGGAGTFLKLFIRALVETRNPAERIMFTALQTGVFIGFAQALTDPSDPSRLYIEQPNYGNAAQVVPEAQPVQGNVPVVTAQPVYPSENVK